MKKVIFTIMTVALFASCNGTKKQSEGQENATIQATEVVTPAATDGHNAQNSLDYQGTYQGTIPAASGDGIEVVVVLQDSTYVRTSTHTKGTEKPVVTTEEGKYTWNADGTTIVLEGAQAESSNQYFVAEGQLMTLDMEGKKVEGELAESYNLKKQ